MSTNTPSRTSSVSRRSMLGGLAGAAVVAWLPGQKAWATAATDTSGVFDARKVPRLDGTLTMSSFRAGNYSKDFGGMREARPRAVLTPRSSRDIAKMMVFAQISRLTIAMNGQSGEPGLLESHSNYGQALTSNGIQINSRGLSRIHSVSTAVADVDAGVTWAELVDAGLAVGARVPALTDYIHLSIGGTVSVGGIGGGVVQHGLQSDLVQWVEVVTGRGQIVRASPTSNRELFDDVRAGAGQFGIITRLGITMTTAQSTATVHTLLYDDVATYLADSEAAMEAGVFEHQAGSLLPNPDGTWMYSIELGSYYSAPEGPRGEEVLKSLRDRQSERTSVTMTYREWAYRVDEFAAAMVQVGYWQNAKPWLNLVLPAERAAEFLAIALPKLGPRDFGAGFCVFAPLTSRTVKSPMFALGASSSGTHFFFDLLCFPGADDVGSAEGLARNRALYEAAVALGGKRYIIGSIDMTTQDWRGHFGSRYDALNKRRASLDPNYVLTPGQGMFPRPEGIR